LRIYIIALLLFFFITANAQHKNAHTNMVWFNYNNTVVLNKNWSWSNDFQLRTREWLQHWWQFAVRTGIQRTLNKKWNISAGFAWFDNVRYYNDEPVFANEWRPWVDASFQIQPKKITMLQRLRFEERFLQKVVLNKKLKDYEVRQRLRYRLEFTFPKIGKQIEIHAGNEIMVNLNHISDSLFFDQNRIFILANLNLTASSFFQFQYIKNFQLLARNYTLENQNIYRFSFHQKLYWHNNKR
jgi:Protein of unknown function (DUF2490)